MVVRTLKISLDRLKKKTSNCLARIQQLPGTKRVWGHALENFEIVDALRYILGPYLRHIV